MEEYYPGNFDPLNRNPMDSRSQSRLVRRALGKVGEELIRKSTFPPLIWTREAYDTCRKFAKYPFDKINVGGNIRLDGKGICIEVFKDF